MTITDKAADSHASYHIDLNDEQLRLVLLSMNMYLRLTLGDWSELCFEFPPTSCGGDKNTFNDMMGHMMAARNMAFPNLHGRYEHAGILENADSATIYDILQVLRYERAWFKHPEGGNTVDFGIPVQMSNQELPKCTVTTQDECYGGAARE